ncbi:hypothetical protein EI94DRAFT_160665 [Lactarius quietus]|nr:hypothetical protein EI94DRAFT_160665 [Lactarius quietus]
MFLADIPREGRGRMECSRDIPDPVVLYSFSLENAVRNSETSSPADMSALSEDSGSRFLPLDIRTCRCVVARLFPPLCATSASMVYRGVSVALVFPFPCVPCLCRMTRLPVERRYILYASNAEHVSTSLGCAFVYGMFSHVGRHSPTNRLYVLS